MIDYETAPNQSMVAGIKRYVENRIRPGHFLTALFSNDLTGTFHSADKTNHALIREWVRWVYNEMPFPMVGSREKVEAWLDDTVLQHSCSQPNCPGRVPVE